MSAAAALTDRLHGALAPMLTDARVPHPLRRAAAEASEADDLLVAAAATVPLILDAEAAADVLAQHARRLRQTLAEILNEAGAPTIRCGQHVASVSAGRPAVVITDPAAIPPELWRQPEPQPDKAAISKLLREGRDIPGAALGNSPPILTIRAKERHA